MNLYITPAEIKSAAPDLIRSTTTKYDDPLYRRCASVSRAIDRRCKRHFYPRMETRYYAGSGNGVLWIDDLISINAVAVSTDGGRTYTTLAADDYYGAVSENFNSPWSYNMIILNQDGSRMGFPQGMRSVRIVGEWGFTDDRAACWEPSGITLESELEISSTAIEVSEADKQNRYVMGTALQLGRLIKIGSEMMLVIDVDAAENAVGVVRAMNGSVAAAHDPADEIYLWMPPFDISQAAMISAVRDLARTQQGYVDTRGGLEVGGQMLWVGRWDPEAEDKISRYIKTGVG
ncbi:MAG: hypothetical protein ACOX5F_01025 [Anaerovoracaceae bacterium]|jgi:hypothetical protein